MAAEAVRGPAMTRSRKEQREAAKRIRARRAESAAPQTEVMTEETNGLIERLERAAETASRVQRGMAEAKSLRQESNTERRTDLYMWPTPEQTLEGQAAAELRRLSTECDTMEKELQAERGLRADKSAECEGLRAALEAVPIPGKTEDMGRFYWRMNTWLIGPYRDALQQTNKEAS